MARVTLLALVAALCACDDSSARTTQVMDHGTAHRFVFDRGATIEHMFCYNVTESFAHCFGCYMEADKLVCDEFH